MIRHCSDGTGGFHRIALCWRRSFNVCMCHPACPACMCKAKRQGVAPSISNIAVSALLLLVSRHPTQHLAPRLMLCVLYPPCHHVHAPDLQAPIAHLHHMGPDWPWARGGCQKRHFSRCRGDAVAEAVKAPCCQVTGLPSAQGRWRRRALAVGRAGLGSPASAMAGHCCLWVPGQMHNHLRSVQLVVTSFSSAQ